MAPPDRTGRLAAPRTAPPRAAPARPRRRCPPGAGGRGRGSGSRRRAGRFRRGRRCRRAHSRSPERIQAAARHQHRLLPGLEPFLQAQPAGLAQQAAADGGRADLRDIEFDEGIGLVAAFRVRGGIVAAGGAEGLVHVGHAQAQLAHRAVVEQGLPSGPRPASRRPCAPGRAPSPPARAGLPADAVGARHRDGRARDAVADHHQRDRGAADDVHRRRRARGGVSTKFRPT